MNHFISSPVAVSGGRKSPVASATPFHAANVLMPGCSLIIRLVVARPKNHTGQMQAFLIERW